MKNATDSSKAIFLHLQLNFIFLLFFRISWPRFYYSLWCLLLVLFCIYICALTLPLALTVLPAGMYVSKQHNFVHLFELEMFMNYVWINALFWLIIYFFICNAWIMLLFIRKCTMLYTEECTALCDDYLTIIIAFWKKII